MRVEPAQLVTGCVLLNDVKGKTNRPLIPKNTVLTEEHIKLLKFFLVKEVDVSAKLASGAEFQPLPPKPKEEEQNTVKTEQEVHPSAKPFQEHYQMVVESYKQLFASWQANLPIDMPAVRKLILPLIERIDEIGSAIYTLHNDETKKDYIYYHSVSVAVLSAFLAKQFGYPKKEWLQIGLAGLLSDAGMAKIDHRLLTKEGPLTYEEKEKIKLHPTYSYRLVEHIPTITTKVKLAVLQHHERMDGSGYPLGLTEDKIHTYGRIVAVADIYHAMTSERPYQTKESPFRVIERLQKKQFSSLDPAIVQILIEYLANFTIGMKVLLSDNRIAEIVFIDAKQPTRPIVRLESSGEVVSLENEPELSIREILQQV